MLGFTRIVKNELLKQNKLPEKFDDYNIGKLYDWNGNIIEVASDFNLNGIKKHIFFAPSAGLDLTPEWQFSVKIKHSNRYDSISIFALDQSSGYNIMPSYAYRTGSSKMNVEPFGTFGNPRVFDTGTTTDKTVDITYRSAKNTTRIYCDVYCYETKKTFTSYIDPSSSYMTKLRPHVWYYNNQPARFTATLVEAYLKDFKFTYDGKIMFKRA